jgi:hypothetical protein
MQTFGIDVSRWQGDFDFAQAKKEGVKYAILKCGGGDDGLYRDSKFERNYNEAKLNGLGVGAYFFGFANSVERAKEEAKFCIGLLQNMKFDYPIFYDVEAERMNVGKDAATEIVKAFCDTLESAGFWCGFYTNLDWYKNKLHGEKLAARYSLWLAWWTQDKPNVNTMQMWQYGGETNYIRSKYVAGQVVDQNYCYVDFPTNIKNAEKNGYTKMTETQRAEEWAIKNGLIKGYGDGEFGWKDAMTREQVATVLYRFYNKLENGELKK